MPKLKSPKGNLWRLLEARQLSMRGLSRLVGVSVSGLSCIFNGQRGARADTVRKMAAGLKVPMETVMEGITRAQLAYQREHQLKRSLDRVRRGGVAP